VIVLNGIVACLNAQYLGFDNGYSISYKDIYPAADFWPGADRWFEVLEWTFGMIFAIELAGKLFVLGGQFPKDWWNWFDALIVSMFIFDAVSDGSFNPTFLRMARFGRMLRLLRLLRSASVFESLQFVVRAIGGCCPVLFSSLLIILIVLSIISVGMFHVITPFQDGSQDIQVRTRIYRNWGTFTRALVTMFETTFANWGPICWDLSNNVSEWFGLFFVVYKCFVGLAVVQVILSVFFQQTFKIAAQDEQIMITQRQNQAASTLKQLTRLFETIDTSGDGKVSASEFNQVMGDQRVKTWLSALDVDAEHITELFALLDDGDGCLAPKEFIEGIKSVKGVAKRMDVLELKQRLHKINLLMIEVYTCMAGTDRSTRTANTPTIDLKLLNAHSL